MVSDPVVAPCAFGKNTTEIAQEAPGATFSHFACVSVKSPAEETVMALSVESE
jgi:hypothetical protein